MKKISNSNICLLMAILALFGVARPLFADFRFTLTGDPRNGYDRWAWTLSEITDKVGDEGVFHITAGDYYEGGAVTTASGFYSRLETEFGNGMLWYPTVGNHETGTTDMTWLRGYYDSDLDGNVTAGPGPSPCHKTTYSWDYANAHFVQLNNYYDGSTDEAGSDFSSALRSWLVDDLDANTKPVVFVIYHEPAYPDGRGGKFSPTGWAEFLEILNDYKVTAGLCADTHQYGRYQVDGAWETYTWEIDSGNAGRLSHGDSWQTFVDITVYDSNDVEFNTWQGLEDAAFTLTDSWSSPATLDLIGHWALDENQGSTAADSSGEENDGTLAGDTDWVTGALNAALVFDGTGDYVDLGNPSVLDFGTYDFTLCAWVKNPVGNNVVAKGGDESGGIRYCLQVGSTVGLLVDDNIDKTSVSGGSGLQDGYWHHVAGVRDGQTLRVFVDATEVASQALPYSPYNLAGTSQHNAYIGAVYQHQASAVGDFYTGSIDDVRIYTGALTSTELAAVMDANAPPPPPPDDRVGHWKLDETSGTTAVDSSAEVNDATFVSSPVWQTPGLDFDGTDDYLNIGNESVLDFGTGDFSICAWINTTVGGDVFTKGWDGTNGVRYEFNIGTTIKFEVDDNSTKVRAYGTTTVNNGQWYHVAIVRDGTTLRTYTDGAPEGTNTLPGGYNLAGTSQGNAYIGVIYDNGGSVYNTFFDGVIEDVRVFDVALSEQDIDDIIAE